jgi:ATP-dependent Clp protease protease subunit
VVNVKIKIKGVIISNDLKWIYDWFEIENTAPKDIDTQIEAAKGEDLDVEINSGGGDVYAGSEIYTALKAYAGNVVVKIVGRAASAASVIAMAGKKVMISPTAQIMIHNVWSYAVGDYRAMEHEAGVLKGFSKSIANAYMLKTGMSQSELLSLMNKETWLTAQDAVKYKFADEIMFDEGMQLAASTQGVMLPRQVIDKLRNLIKGAPQQPIDLKDFDAKQLAEILRNAPRSGASEDIPEGTRYITISDTLANQIADLISPLETEHVTEPMSQEASRQVPVDLYTKLYENLERRAKIC